MEMIPLFVILIFLKYINFSNGGCTEWDTIKNLKILSNFEDDYDNADDYYEYDQGFLLRTKRPITNENITLLCENISSVENVENSKGYSQLKFIDSNLTILKSMAFKNFESVTKLYLTNSSIKEIQPTAFDGLTKLEELHLSHNQLQEVQKGVFNSLHSLRILTLNDNQIHNIEKNSFIGCSELNELFLQRNQIKRVEDLEFTDLKHLDLAENPLRYFDINATLKTLNLSFTSIEELKMSNFEVTKLTLKNSSLKKISFLPRGEAMDFSQNKLTDLQLADVNVSNVTFSGNLISSISGKFRSVFFNISDNKLTVLKNLIFDNEIETLDFSFNRISEIQVTTFQNSSLKFLYLQHNNLSRIPPSLFNNLHKLKVLNIGYNQIEELQFGTFDTLTKLKTLDLSNNKLKSLNEKIFHSIRVLENLYIDNNQISSLDLLSLRIYDLRNISLDKNNWTCAHLANIKSYCRAFPLNMIKGSSYDSDNVDGIACKNDKEVNIPIKIDNITKSPLIEFFEKDFKNSNFIKFFNNSNFGNTENKEVQSMPVNAAPDYSGIKLILGIIFVSQTFILIILLFGCFFIVRFLKNYKTGRQHMQLSQIEFCE